MKHIQLFFNFYWWVSNKQVSLTLCYQNYFVFLTRTKITSLKVSCFIINLHIVNISYFNIYIDPGDFNDSKPISHGGMYQAKKTDYLNISIVFCRYKDITICEYKANHRKAFFGSSNFKIQNSICTEYVKYLLKTKVFQYNLDIPYI